MRPRLGIIDPAVHERRRASGQARRRRRIVAGVLAVITVVVFTTLQAMSAGLNGVLLLGGAVAGLGAAVWSTPSPFGARMGGQTPSGSLFVDHLAREFDRSRRHGRTFTLARWEFASSAEAVSATRAMTDLLRQTDVLARSKDRVFLLLPETDRDCARLLVKRLSEEVGDTEEPTLVSYPEQGVTVGALLEALGGPKVGGRAVVSEPLLDAYRETFVDANYARRPAMLVVNAGNLRVKRLIDLVVLAVVAPLLVPLGLLLALAVKVDSRGCVLFAQQRTGLHGHRFKMYKFRSMVANAEELKASLQHLNILEPPDFKIPNDPRITRVGRFLRATSLDELPQLLNVLYGDMTLVGPRPTSFSADLYEAWHTQRLEVPPGVTGLWQVSARHESGFDERLRLDVAYMTSMSLWTDVRIVGRTITSVVKARGA
jgi:lipopolysaccharide/colanic/teichoic acid biosynthesis glycosyltransferase